ncbi:hypothetical protein AK812_SmicGene13170 [Symbiodinium microadriaticum]|uniref:Methyltransferase FkbM domain-containing protein n=1 Tax=Symbiodinium microadriaticum TaxID=2951 RepID=A0A1Q9E8T8_SYMMI|nr:hypothetical protein AK812_SmicGene13170 [Symbiodinium microadriaticum]
MQWSKKLGWQVLRNGLESRIEVVQAADKVDDGQLVSTVALDALLQKRPRLCALKIDVEGSEEEALMGAWQSLHLRPRLLMDLGYRDVAVKLLSDHESNCLSASGSRLTPRGDGVHAEYRWRGANLLGEPGCRCWDFDAESGAAHAIDKLLR